MGFNEARDEGLSVTSAEPYADICTSPQTDNHANTTSCKFFYRPDAIPDAPPTVSNH